jgi:hypothetical protein
MNQIELAQHRERLIAQAAAQRVTLTQHIEGWRAPLARVDQGLHLLRIIRRHSAWAIGGVALLAFAKPVRTFKWIRRGWLAWQIMHRLRRG